MDVTTYCATRHCPEPPSTSLGLGHLGRTITRWKRALWSHESVFQAFVGRNGRPVLQTKEEKNHPDCHQQQVQKPRSVMVRGRVSALGKGNLPFCDGTVNAEKFMEILEQNMLPSRRRFEVWRLGQNDT